MVNGALIIKSIITADHCECLAGWPRGVHVHRHQPSWEGQLMGISYILALFQNMKRGLCILALFQKIKTGLCEFHNHCGDDYIGRSAPRCENHFEFCEFCEHFQVLLLHGIFHSRRWLWSSQRSVSYLVFSSLSTFSSKGRPTFRFTCTSTI